MVTELEYVEEKVIPLLTESSFGELRLDAAELRENFGDPREKLVEVFQPISERLKLTIHIWPEALTEKMPDFQGHEVRRIVVESPLYYWVAWQPMVLPGYPVESTNGS